MRAVKNITTKICGCSALPNLYTKGGRKRKKFPTDWDLIDNFYIQLDRFCILKRERRKKFRCDEQARGEVHSKFGIVDKGTCRYCGNTIWEFVLHPPLRDEEDFDNSVTGESWRNIFTIPVIIFPTSRDITLSNQHSENEF